MVKIVNFTPERDNQQVSLKSNIQFDFTELAPFQPNSDSVPELPNQTLFRQLTDKQAIELKQSDAVLYIDTTTDLATTQQTIEANVQLTDDPDGPTTKTGLSTATDTQINNEVGESGRVTEFRNSVEAGASAFIAIKYQTEEGFEQIPTFPPNPDPTSPTGNPLNTVNYKLERDNKGQVLASASRFKQLNLDPASQPDNIFSNYVIAGSEQNTLVTKIISNNRVEVASPISFQENGQLTLVFCENFLRTSDTIRDVAYFKIKQVLQPTPEEKATLLTTNSSTNDNLFWQAKQPGSEANAISVEYVEVSSGDPLLNGENVSATIQQNQIILYIDSTNKPTSIQAKTAIDSNDQITEVVEVTAIGSEIIDQFPRTNLSGGVPFYGYSLVFAATENYPLLSEEEQKLTDPDVNSRIIAIPGVPVLLNQKSTTAALSLFEAEAFIEGEIPKTKLYIPSGDTTTDLTEYVGNLYIPSVTVLLYEDDKEVSLVRRGRAEPGVSIDYKLITTDSLTQKFGDVQATIKLTGAEIDLPITGFTQSGSRAVQVGARLASTPSRTIELGKAFDSNSRIVQAFDPILEITKTAENFSKEDETPGEFYFNKQFEIQNKLIDLNSYGTIRLRDEVEIIKISNGVSTTIITAKVEAILEQQNQIVLDKSIPTNINSDSTTRFVVRVPQTPLNPNRRYRVTVHAVDRDEVRFDVNRDSTIDQQDRNLVASRVNQSGLLFPNTADINLDSTVDQTDLDLIEEKLTELSTPIRQQQQNPRG